VHHALHARANRLKLRQSQELQRCGREAAHEASAIASAVVGVFRELGMEDPVPPLNVAEISR
jgi:hypothetical protein